jgi:hypothetical protein
VTGRKTISSCCVLCLAVVNYSGHRIALRLHPNTYYDAPSPVYEQKMEKRVRRGTKDKKKKKIFVTMHINISLFFFFFLFFPLLSFPRGLQTRTRAQETIPLFTRRRWTAAAAAAVATSVGHATRQETFRGHRTAATRVLPPPPSAPAFTRPLRTIHVSIRYAPPRRFTSTFTHPLGAYAYIQSYMYIFNVNEVRVCDTIDYQKE